MNIVADRNIPGISDMFAPHGNVLLVDGRSLSRTQLRDAEILLVRSVTKVHRELLMDTPVKFVGSATIGLDHMDIGWLESQRIRWTNAPGCNADAASQYTVAMILLASRRLAIDPRCCKIGIVGYGNVGKRVYRLLSTLGVKGFKICDPPLEQAGAAPDDMEFLPLAALNDCQVICLHVPLTSDGAHPTSGLIDHRFLQALEQGALLVNSARGGVVRGDALQEWLESGKGHAALDVFPGEPEIDPDLVAHCTVSTPHVAGYSLDGRWNGTAQVYREFCSWLGQPAGTGELAASLPAESLSLGGNETPGDIILQACPVERDDLRLRDIMTAGAEERAFLFDRLRSEYPPRRDFCGWTIRGNCPPELRETLTMLGFH